MASLSLIGAVGVRVRPDTKGFRNETKREVLSQLNDLDLPVDVTPEISYDPRQAQQDLARLFKGGKFAQKVTVDVEGNLKTESIKDALSDLKKEIDQDLTLDIDVKTLKAEQALQSFDDNLEGMKDALQETKESLEELVSENERSMTRISNQIDSAGESVEGWGDKWIEASDKVQEMEAAYGDAYTELSRLDNLSSRYTTAETQRLEKLNRARRDAAKAFNNEANEKTMRALERAEEAYNNAFTKANERAADRIQKDAEKAEQAWQRSVDELAKVSAKLEEAENHQVELMLAAEETRDEYTQTRRELDSLISKQEQNVEVQRRSLRAQEDQVANLREAAQAAKANADEEAARLRRFVAHNRLAAQQVRAIWDDLGNNTPDFMRRWSQTLTQGVTAIAGGGTWRRMSAEMRESLRNMDVLVGSVAKLSTALGALGSVGTASLGGLLIAGRDLGDMFNLLAGAPALLGELGAMTWMAVKGFKNFGDAVGGSEEALAALPSTARDAATALGGMLDQLTEIAQPAVWRGIGDSMTSAINAIERDFLSGMERIAEGTGKAMAGAFDSIGDFARNGEFATLMNNMATAVDQFANAFGPATKGLMDLMLIGSAQLPQFNRWLTEMSQNFADWTQRGKETGEIAEGIQRGAEAAQDMGSIVGSTLGVLGALADVAVRAGAPSLGKMADAMEKVEAAARGGFFQGHMTDIMRGAITATEDMSRGFAELGQDILSESENIETVMRNMGKVVERSLTASGDAFRNSRFQEGMLEFFSDLEEGSLRFDSIMDELAMASGDLMKVGGEVVKAMLQIAEAFLKLWNDSTALSDSLVELIPTLADLLTAFIQLAHGPVSVLVDVLSTLIDLFNGLPGPVQGSIAALAALAMVSPRIAAVTGSVKGLGTALGNMRGAWKAASSGTSVYTDRLRAANGSLSTLERGMLGTVGTLNSMATSTLIAGQHWREAGQHGADAMNRMRDSASRAGSSIKGSLLGVTPAFNRISDGARRAGSSLTNTGTVAQRAGRSIASAFAEAATGRGLPQLRTEAQRTSTSLQSMGNIARTVGASSFAPLNTGIQGVNTQMRNTAGSVGSFKSSLGGMAASAGRAAASIGGAGKAGLKGALSGITGVLGGPWGVALAGASVAVMEFGRRNSEAKAKVEAIKGTLDDMGGTTEATMTQVANSINEGFAPLMKRDIRDMGSSVGETLSKIGISSEEMASKLLNSRGEFDSMASDMTKVTAAGQEGEDALQRLSDATGISVDTLRGMRPELANAGHGLNEVASQSDAAGTSFENLKGSMDGVLEPSQDAMDLAAALGEIGDEANDASTKVDALERALATLNGEDIDADEAIKNLTNEIVNGEQALSSYSEEFGSVSGAISDATGQLDLNNAAGVEMHDIISSNIRAAREQGAATGNMAEAQSRARAGFEETARAAGITGEELNLLMGEYDRLAQASASEILMKMGIEGGEEAISKIDEILRKAGVEFDGQEFAAWLEADKSNADLAMNDLDAAIDKFVNSEYEAEFGVDKTQVDAGIQAAENAGVAWDGESFEAWLKADPANAELAAANAEAAGEAWAASEYRAQLSADGEMGKALIQELQDRGTDFDQARFEAWLGLNADEFREKKLSTDQILNEWENAEHDIKVGLNDGDLKAKMDGLNVELKALDASEWEATLTADDSDFAAVMQQADAKGVEISDPSKFKAFISANAEQFKSEGLTIDQMLDRWATEQTTAKVDADTSSAETKLDNVETKTLTIDGRQVQVTMSADDGVSDKVNQAIMALDGMDGKSALSYLQAQDDATQKAIMARLGIQSFDGMSGQALLNALDNTDFALSGAKIKVGSFDLTTASADLTTTDNTAPGLQTAINAGTLFALRDFRASLSGDGQPFITAKNGVTGQAMIWDGSTWTSSLSGDTQEAAAAKAAADIMGQNWASSTHTGSFDGDESGAQSAKTSSDGMAAAWDRTSGTGTFDGDESGAQGAKTSSDSMLSNWGASSSTGKFNGDSSGVGVTYNNALSIGRDWAGKIFTAVFSAVNKAKSADGNIFGSMRFAQGGLADIQRFANGGNSLAEDRAIRRLTNRAGAEQHTAQISTPRTPFRIWAEPETGGEAYIPLAASKRARSTRIWEQTGARLGVDVKKYAEGSPTGDSAYTPSVSRSGSGTTVNVTNHYPQAEPTSTTTNRALQYAAALS